MADRNARVQDLVREQLQKNPEASTRELQAAAQGIDAAIGELSLRQFNAGYVLPLKRKGGGGKRQAKAKPAGGQRRGRPARQAQQPAREAAPTPSRRAGRTAAVGGGGNDRDRVRTVLVQFARDISEAESRGALVAIVGDVDRYVDQIVGSRG